MGDMRGVTRVRAAMGWVSNSHGRSRNASEVDEDRPAE